MVKCFKCDFVTDQNVLELIVLIAEQQLPRNEYCNDPKFSDRQVLENSADPDQV